MITKVRGCRCCTTPQYERYVRGCRRLWYVCIYACMYLCMYVYIYYIYIMYVYTYIYIYTHVFMCVSMYVCIYNMHIYTGAFHTLLSVHEPWQEYPVIY